MPSCRVTLHRFADVDAALRCADLVVPGVTASRDPVHRVVQRGVREHMGHVPLHAVRASFVTQLCQLLDTPRAGAPWCFVADIATPWAHAVTGRLMDLPPATVQEGAALAAVVFEAAAHSDTGDSTAEAHRAASMLYHMLAQCAVPGPAHAPLNPAAVQTFVALTHSLPALLASAVHTLLVHPAQYAWLRAHTAETLAGATLAGAAHELLRYATPSRAVYRRAVRETRIGDIVIATDDLVVLQLAAANRDPARFTDPDALQLAAGRAGHLAFGSGPHHCSGATLVHGLVECLLEALATSPVSLSLGPPPAVQWLDAPALRAPVRLAVEVAAAR